MPQNKPMKIQWITVNGRQVPLVLPQTYSYKDDDWKVTSDQDPLPVVEYGTTAGGIIVPKRVSNEGHELTQLTGSKVEEIFVFNAVTLDTTAELSSQTFGVSKFQQIHVLARNTLNTNVTIRMRIDGFWIRSKDDAQGSWTVATIEPNINYTYSLNTYKPYLFQNVIGTVQFIIKAENPPTSGSVTIKILGRY